MNEFLNGINKNKTEKGGNTNASSGNPVLDFMFQAGASRTDVGVERAKTAFSAAFRYDPLLAMRTLFFVRSVRKGLGERRVFREIVQEIASGFYGANAIAGLLANLDAIPEHGRWDDLDSVIGRYNSRLSSEAVSLWLEALARGNRLAAKWAPRENNKRRARVFKELVRRVASLAPSEVPEQLARQVYRQAVVSKSDTVEQKISSNEWYGVDYEKIPAVAIRKYRAAFLRHDPRGWAAYIEGLRAGKKKVNTAYSPGDLVAPYLSRLGFAKEDALLEEQWKTMVGKMNVPGGLLPMVDTSGSMFGNGLPIKHAVGLGLAITNSQPEPWRGLVLNFSQDATIQKIDPSESLIKQVSRISSMNWGMTTNLYAAFTNIVSVGVANSVPAEDMPKCLLILSDMEFDYAVRGEKQTLYESGDALFKRYGYETPVVVFWNLQGRGGAGGAGNVPVLAGDKRTVLISGYSVQALKYIFGLDTPSQLLDEINEVMSDIVDWQ